jgi:hypothetical protein
MQPEETRHDRGLATMRKMFGPGIDSALKSTVPDGDKRGAVPLTGPASWALP